MSLETVAEIVDSLARGDTMEALEETGRFLYVYNSTTLIASVGAIVGLVIFGSLLWIAISSTVVGGFGFGRRYGADDYGGHYRANDDHLRHARAAQDNEPTLEQVLAQLDAVFKKMNVKHAECKKRVVCEAHRPSLNGAPDSRPIRDIIRKLEKVGPKPTSIPYLAARDRGAAAVGDQCAQLYRKCPRDALWPTE